VRLRACYVWVRKFEKFEPIYIYFVLKTQRRRGTRDYREAGLNVYQTANICYYTVRRNGSTLAPRLNTTAVKPIY